MSKIYVCAPYDDAIVVRDLHALLRRYGFTPTSSWAEKARGPENLFAVGLEELQARAAQNDADIEASDIVLVKARPLAGGEMFAEVRFAIERRKSVYWVGRRILSAYRAGVSIFDDIDDAIVALLARKVPSP